MAAEPEASVNPVAVNPVAVNHVYVHVPFCPTICPFCDFHVLERRAGLVDAYLDRLDREAAEVADRLDVRPTTVYLGGGTPSHLRPRELERLCSILRRRLGAWETPLAEATLEVHPSTVNAARVAQWAALGFTRVSVGVQSTSDDVLRFLGRPHDAARALQALDLVLDAGAFQVSADLITAVPGQDLEADLRAVAGRGVDHLSAYTLTIEEGTPFHRQGVEVDAEAEAAALALASAILPEYGLARYEVSNHARPGAESHHNLGYWRNRFYLGLGPGAGAYEPPTEGDPLGVAGWRHTNLPLPRWQAGEAAEAEAVGPRDVVVEGLLVGLRLAEGADLDGLSAQAGVAVDDVVGPAVDRLVAAGLLRRSVGRLYATEAGLTVLDRVVAELV